jgi:hypothetical protein
MKKKLKLLATTFLLFINVHSQSDYNRIILNPVFLENEIKCPEEAKNQLIDKLKQYLTKNGLGGESINERFVFAAKINIQSKDIVPGPPQFIAVNIEMIFFIGDAISKKLFSTTTLNLKGVGNNENKAIISAIQQINLNIKNIDDVINTGKIKIISYYESQCDYIINKALTLSYKKEYDAGIYELMQIPDICKVCYQKSLDALQNIYKNKIDLEGKQALQRARITWNTNSSLNGAVEISNILSKIDPSSSSYNEAVNLTEIIRKKLISDEKINWDFKMKTYSDEVELAKQRIESQRQITMEYYKNKPRTIIYNKIVW